MIHLIPDTGRVDEISELSSRTGIPLHNPKNAREFVLMTQTDPISLVAINEDLMLILSRHAMSFFPNGLPAVLHSVPGLIYQPGWASMATIFPPVHFKDFAEMTKRSGVLATDAKAMEERGMGALVLDNRTTSVMSEDGQEVSAEDVPHDGSI